MAVPGLSLRKFAYSETGNSWAAKHQPFADAEEICCLLLVLQLDGHKSSSLTPSMVTAA